LDLVHRLGVLGLCAAFFAALALVVKGRRAFADAQASAGEMRISLVVSLLNQVTIGPLIVLGYAAIGVLKPNGPHLPTAGFWTLIGQWPTLFLAVFLGDFFAYWRHRAQHSRWLWPAHAVHHSDTRLNWLSLERLHPIDQVGSAMDTVLLALMGFPFWALAGNTFVRHYYGYLIHADVPWTWGKANLVFNSPAMHRWHHVRDVDGSGYNFATVFSVFDRLFGTYYQPGPCTAPLGVRESLGKGAVGQYLHPLKVWWRALRPVQATRADNLAQPSPGDPTVA
jgi:sterol desaturase/sphingolipid hydroxylase (fatty acid hydroxylase superfamily)